VREVIFVDRNQKLVISSLGGETMWTGPGIYAATSHKIEGKIEDLRFNMIDFYYIPSQILTVDLNNDAAKEIILTQNTDTFGRFMPEGTKTYETMQIVSLSWAPTGLVENWKTHTISGMVTSIRLADLNDDGITELLASVIMSSYQNLWESRSVIFSYDLNLSNPEQTAKTSDEKG
jgi:hypothetical protein